MKKLVIKEFRKKPVPSKLNGITELATTLGTSWLSATSPWLNPNLTTASWSPEEIPSNPLEPLNK